MSYIPFFSTVFAPKYLLLALGHNAHKRRANNMRHINDPPEGVHMLSVQLIARPVCSAHAGKYMPRQTGNRFPPVAQKPINLSNFLA